MANEELLLLLDSNVWTMTTCVTTSVAVLLCLLQIQIQTLSCNLFRIVVQQLCDLNNRIVTILHALRRNRGISSQLEFNST